MSQTRRLAAILAADVAGYSRLMGADEEGTLAGLKAMRLELVDPRIVELRVKPCGSFDRRLRKKPNSVLRS
jgi:adenylate cyclase